MAESQYETRVSAERTEDAEGVFLLVPKLRPVVFGIGIAVGVVPDLA